MPAASGPDAGTSSPDPSPDESEPTDPSEPEPEDEPEPHQPDEPPPFEPGDPVLPRLTTNQYRNTLRDVFGTRLPSTPLQSDTNPYSFYNIGATRTEVSPFGAEKFDSAALDIAQTIFSDEARRDTLIGCTPSAPDDECAKKFIERIGTRLYRRPLDSDEVSRWLDLSRKTANGDPYRGLQTVVAGLLESPKFLYRIELGEIGRAHV